MFGSTQLSDAATLLLLLHPFNGLFSRTTWISRYQKGKIHVGTCILTMVLSSSKPHYVSVPTSPSVLWHTPVSKSKLKSTRKPEMTHINIETSCNKVTGSAAQSFTGTVSISGARNVRSKEWQTVHTHESACCYSIICGLSHTFDHDGSRWLKPWRKLE